MLALTPPVTGPASRVLTLLTSPIWPLGTPLLPLRETSLSTRPLSFTTLPHLPRSNKPWTHAQTTKLLALTLFPMKLSPMEVPLPYKSCTPFSLSSGSQASIQLRGTLLTSSPSSKAARTTQMWINIEPSPCSKPPAKSLRPSF